MGKPEKLSDLFNGVMKEIRDNCDNGSGQETSATGGND